MPSQATATRPHRVALACADGTAMASAQQQPLSLVPHEREVPAGTPLDSVDSALSNATRSITPDDLVDQGGNPDDEPVLLWNPYVAALLSLVLTPVFGAWLHHRNALELGDPRLRRVARMWLGVALAFTASGLYLVSAGQLAPTSAFSASALLGGYTIVWYAFAGHKQSRIVARLSRPQWRPRSFLKPVAVASLLMALPALVVWVRSYL
ncbi:MAG: hypothetical protein IPG93_08620 [Burkholderiales bacterium]|nr:hypothetical protein [Burkholderiales bacterium]